MPGKTASGYCLPDPLESLLYRREFGHLLDRNNDEDANGRLARPCRPEPGRHRFSHLLQNEKDDIQEWDIYTSVPAVLEFVESKTVIEASSL